MLYFFHEKSSYNHILLHAKKAQNVGKLLYTNACFVKKKWLQTQKKSSKLDLFSHGAGKRDRTAD